MAALIRPIVTLEDKSLNCQTLVSLVLEHLLKLDPKHVGIPLKLHIGKTMWETYNFCVDSYPEDYIVNSLVQPLDFIHDCISTELKIEPDAWILDAQIYLPFDMVSNTTQLEISSSTQSKRDHFTKTFCGPQGPCDRYGCDGKSELMWLKIRVNETKWKHIPVWHPTTASDHYDNHWCEFTAAINAWLDYNGFECECYEEGELDESLSINVEWEKERALRLDKNSRQGLFPTSSKFYPNFIQSTQ